MRHVSLLLPALVYYLYCLTVFQRWGGSPTCSEFPPAGPPAFDPKAVPLITVPPGAGTSLTGSSLGLPSVLHLTQNLLSCDKEHSVRAQTDIEEQKGIDLEARGEIMPTD